MWESGPVGGAATLKNAPVPHRSEPWNLQDTHTPKDVRTDALTDAGPYPLPKPKRREDTEAD